MSVRHESTGRRRVAVGETREAAARAFGASFPDLFLTTYADLAAEVDLADVEVLALADGPGQEPVLARALAGEGALPSDLRVEVAADAARRQELARALGSARWRVSDVAREDGRVVLALAPQADGTNGAGVVGVLLDAVAEPTPPSSGTLTWPAAEPSAGAAQPQQGQPQQGQPQQGQPRPGRDLKKMILGAGVLGLVLAVVVLVAVGRSDLGADGVLVTLVLGLALLQLATLVGVAYLVRHLRRSARDEAEFRSVVLRRTERAVQQGVALRERSQKQGRRLAEVHKVAVTARQQQRGTHRYVLELAKQVARTSHRARSFEQSLHLKTQRQTQALLNLQRLVDVKAAVPPAGGWAASPDLLLFSVDTLLQERPAVVLECGSGISTLYLALAAQQHGLSTKVVALEHQAPYAEATRRLLEKHGVADYAEVRLAPLEPSSVPGHETPWYAESALEGLDDIGMLLVDGPPTATGPQARFPAVPLLRDRLSPRCTIVMDDLVRPADLETAESWAGLLPDFELTVVREFDKHVGLLRRG